MADAIKAAAKIFVITFLVVAAVATMPFAAGTFVAAEGAALTMAALSAGMTLVSGLFTKDIDASVENFGSKLAGRSPTAARPIVYGMARVGGTITHMQTSGTDNHKLGLIIALAGHEIESLEKVFVNGKELTTTSSGGFFHATNSDFTNSENDNKFTVSNSLLRFAFFDGSQTASSSLVTSNTSLTSSAKFKEVAYVFMECIFDSEKFGGGVPQLAFVIKGKKVFDPRTSQTTFSDNPALCIRDYIVNTRYGLRATTSEVNDTTSLGGFAAAANTCESGNTVGTATVDGAVNNSVVVTVDLAAGVPLLAVGKKVTGTGISGTVKVVERRGVRFILDTAVTIADGTTITFSEQSYTANGFTNMSADGQGVIQGLLSSCAGKLSYINGQFVMFAGANVTPQMTINDENILAPIQLATNSGGGENYNTVKSVFVDANQKYTSVHAPTFTSTTHLNNDTPTSESTANYVKNLETQLPFTTTSAMAQRLQKIQLLYSRQQTALSVLCNIAYLQLQPFDRVNLTNERLGFTNKQFEVISTQLELLDSGGTPVLANRLELKEISNDVYNFLQTDYTNPLEDDNTDNGGDYSVTAPTGLGLTQRSELEGANTKIDIEVAWTNNPDDLIQGTEVAYKLSTDANFEGHFVVGKGETKGLIPNVVIGKTYNVKVRHFSTNNVFSDYTSAVNLAITDPNAISAPTNLEANGFPLGIAVSWTNPNTSAFRAVKVYRKTSNSEPTNDNSVVATIAGQPNKTSFIQQGKQDGLTAGTTYYFWVKAVTFTGTESSFAGSVNAAFADLGKGDVGLSNVTNDTQIKDDGSNAPNILKNDQISIAKSGSSIRLSNTGTDTDITLAKGDVGLGNVLNAEQVREDLANAPNAIKNNQVTLAKDGSGNLSLNNAGSGNVSFDKDDVGLGNLANKRQVDEDLSNAPNAIKNNQISIGADGSLANAGGGQVTVAGIGAETPSGSQAKVDNRLSTTEKGRLNAGKSPDNSLELNNADVDKAHVGLGNVDNLAASAIRAGTTKSDVGLGNVDNDSTATIRAGTTKSDVGLADVDNLSAAAVRAGTTKNDVGLGNVTNDAQVKSDGSNAPNILKNDQITLSLSGTTLGLNNAGSGSQTLSKTSVGLSNLADLDSTQNSKLTGIEANATVGARLNDNLLDESGSDLADSDVVTSQGTSNDTNNVNSVARADVTTAIQGAQTNIASMVSGLAGGTQPVNANALNAGQINSSLLKVDELFLPTQGTASSGQTVNFFSSMTQVSLGSLGDGAGFYMGTISVQITDAQSDDIRGASFHIDLKSGSTTVYTKYWPIGIKEGNQYYDHTDQFGDSQDLPVMHLEFAYFHTSNTALNLFVNADSNDSTTTCLVKARAVRFGAETVSFNPTSVAGATVAASTDNTFASVTVSGFTGSKQVNLTGNSTALVSVNSGTFVNAASAGTITANQTFAVKMTSSATAGAQRTATVEIGGTAITFVLTTTGTYTPTYSGGGGGGSAGGGFESNQELF